MKHAMLLLLFFVSLCFAHCGDWIQPFGSSSALTVLEYRLCGELSKNSSSGMFSKLEFRNNSSDAVGLKVYVSYWDYLKNEKSEGTWFRYAPADNYTEIVIDTRQVIQIRIELK